MRAFPKLHQQEDKFLCEHCCLNKQKCNSHPALETSNTQHILKHLHLDVIGPDDVQSLGGNKHVLVSVDNGCLPKRIF